MTVIVYVNNTNSLTLEGLRDALDATYINDATVTVTVKDKDGANVAGQTWPLSMPYLAGSNGDYRAILVHGIAILNGVKYTAVVDADIPATPTNYHYHAEFEFMAETRTS